MSIRSYFTVRKRDASEDELEVVIPSSMAESIKTELQRTGGARVKRSIDGEGGATEKKRGAYEKITPEKGQDQEVHSGKWSSSTLTNSRHFPRQYRCVAALWHDRLALPLKPFCQCVLV